MQIDATMAVLMTIGAFGFGFLAARHFSGKRPKHFRDAHHAARYLTKFLRKDVRQTDVAMEQHNRAVIRLTTNDHRVYLFRFDQIDGSLNELPTPNDADEMRRAIGDWHSLRMFLKGRGLMHPAIPVCVLAFDGMWEETHRKLLEEACNRTARHVQELKLGPPLTLTPTSN